MGGTGLLFWYVYWIFEPSLNRTVMKFTGKVNIGNFAKQEGEQVINNKGTANIATADIKSK